MKTIETERLLLQPLGEARLEEYVALTADPQAMRYWSPLGTFSREQAEERFERALARTRLLGFGRRWIVLKETGTGIGFTEMQLLGEGYDISAEDVELGWVLTPLEWGKGYATEAGRAVRDEAFERLGLDSVIALHHPGNPASGRVMEKLGMAFERDGVDPHGPYRLYRLSRERWEELPFEPGGHHPPPHCERIQERRTRGWRLCAECLTAAGHPHGVRLAGPTRGRSRLLRGHPRRAACAAGAHRRPRRPVRPPRHRRDPDLAAQPRDRANPRRARGRARPPGLHRDEALASAHPRGGRARARATEQPRLVGLVLAPHYSRLSIGDYRRRLDEALDQRARLAFVDSWHDDPGLVAFLADRVRGTKAHVVFTAHSLPARILDEGDPYERELLTTARLVAEQAQLDRWSFSYQSESATGEPWLGPDILDHLTALHDQQVDDVLICPIGFVADHLEIRWDIDVEAAERARELGMQLARIEMPNADPAFVAVLARLVTHALAQQPAPA